jgi:Winged helix DNA-binding domain
LAGQYLTGARADTGSQVVRSLGAVQAQEYLDAKWALALRTRGARDADIERELDEGSILRIHLLRPTWHFVAREDIHWMLSLSGPRVNAGNTYRYRQLELDEKVFRTSQDVLRSQLAGGKHRSRAELREALENVGIVMEQNRLAHILMRAELEGIICSGPRRGKQFTYALLHERVPPTPMIERDEALLRLARRYFATRGPATASDFAWWSGLTKADVVRAIDLAGGELQKVMIEDQAYWQTAPNAPAKASPSAHLLPIFDEYFIGLRDRSAMGRHLPDPKGGTRGDPLNANFVFVNGQIVGRWMRRLENNRVVIALDLLTAVTRADIRRIAAQAHRFGEFLGMPVELAKVQS